MPSGFRLDSPVKLPVASEMPRCAPPHTNGAGEEPCQGGDALGPKPPTRSEMRRSTSSPKWSFAQDAARTRCEELRSETAAKYELIRLNWDKTLSIDEEFCHAVLLLLSP